MRVVLVTSGGVSYVVSEDEYDDDILAEAEINLRRLNNDDGSSSGRFEYSFSTSVNLCGDAAQLIRDETVNQPTTDKIRNGFVLLQIFDDCCVEDFLLYEGRITVKSLDWCEFDGDGDSCCVEINTEEYTKVIDKASCVRTTLIEAREKEFKGYNNFWEYPHASMQYCFNHNKALVIIYSIIGILFLFTFGSILLILAPILSIINAIIFVVNAIVDIVGGDKVDEEPTSISDVLLGTILSTIQYIIYPCNFGHLTPKVRNYIDNVCNHCDLTFESSILNNPNSTYYDLMYLYNQNDKGFKVDIFDSGIDNILTLFDEYGDDDYEYQNEYFSNYSPNITGGGLLDDLVKVFNAEWWIDNDILRFEKKREKKKLLLDVTQLPISEKISQCYELTEIDAYSRILDLKYTLDGVDQSGDNNKFLYDDVVKMSDNNNFKDYEEISIPFGAVSCEGRDKDNVVKGGEAFAKIANTIVGTISAASLDFSPPKIDTDQYKGALFLTTGTMSFAKLILPNNDNDGVRGSEFSTVKTIEQGGERYPQPEMWFNAAAKPYNQGVKPFDYSNPQDSSKIVFDNVENLFQFFTDKDPDLLDNDFVGIKVVVTIRKECEYYEGLLNSLRGSGEINHNLYIIINYGEEKRNAFVDEVNITLDRIKITATF